MFDSLSDKLQGALGDLRKKGKLDEEAISRAMREIRLALLEADVNFTVVRDFVAHVRERALGEEVLKSLSPGQQVVKVVHDELTELMGSGESGLAFGKFTVILLAGLQGSGKTTTAAKLALHLQKAGRKPGLVAADLQRPAAIDQLEQLGKQIDIPVFRTDTKDAVEATRSGLERARSAGLDTVIVDTAGRLQIDEELMAELQRVRDEAKPLNVLLVVDAMTGQEAVNVAQAFDERISFDGVILTKLDGDARGGAALSVKAVTGKPIKFASTGEKLDALEVFHPDRMASRILGMGDVLTLIERAEAAVAEDDQAEMEKRMRAGQFTFDDFLKAYKMLRKMGPLQGILKMIPGLGSQLGDVDVDEQQMVRVEAIVLSMTPERTAHAAFDRRQAQNQDRERLRCVRRTGEPAARGTQADGEDDETDGTGEDAGPPDPAGAYPAFRDAEVGDQAQEKEGRTEVKDTDGCEAEAHSRGLEEEPDLPRCGGRFARPA